MKVPLFWRVVNLVRRWFEDRSVEDGQYLQQMKALREVDVVKPSKSAVILNLRQYRLAHKRVA